MTATALPPTPLCPRPEIAPPPITDAAWVPLAVTRSSTRSVQDELPLEEQPKRLRHRPSATTDRLFERRPTATADLPPAPQFVARMAVALSEIAAGARPATQVMRHCSPKVFESLLRRQSHQAGRAPARRAVVVRRVRVCDVRDGIVEAVVVLADKYRVRPLALRIEGLDGRWIITALDMG
ncbi:Rv3235 family protein [Austwickia chelonae]|uniref:Rv3235 family protein n=1 Tax=Austwickia chelonae TaxID=100225 RepID=UPI000E26FB20|nr:Rv3235 family protein [Austwickia chelonae]